MALNGDALGMAIKNAIDSLSDEDKIDRDKVFKEMGKAIVTYVTTNAVVNVTVASVGGVTPGGGTSGPGAGTGLIT